MQKLYKTTQTMKKLFIVLICVTLFCSVKAQDQHLSFKGVPINGTLKEYTNSMVKKGFHFEGTEDGLSILSGDFAGFKDCYIGVSTLKSCDVVSHIAVIFPNRDKWSLLISDYETLKTMLTEKYGAPDDYEERFTGHVGGDDYFKMHALHSGEYEWYTVFRTDLGSIELSLIEGTEYSTGCVRLSYYDKANSEKVMQSAMDDL